MYKAMGNNEQLLSFCKSDIGTNELAYIEHREYEYKLQPCMIALSEIALAHGRRTRNNGQYQMH